MKQLLRYASFLVAATVLLSASMVVFAKEKKNDLPTEANCAVNVEGDKITISGSNTATTHYAIKDKAVTFAVDSTGLVLTYPAQGDSIKTIRLGKQINAFNVSGTLESLTFDDTLDYHYVITVDVAVDQLTAKGDVKLILTGSTAINALTLVNDKAVVTAESGASILNTNRALNSETDLTVTIRDYRANTSSASYDSATRILSLKANKAGCTVTDALKDVILNVRQIHGDLAVAGQWYWPNLDGNATASGRYLYRFTPTQGAGTQELTIAFTEAESAS